MDESEHSKGSINGVLVLTLSLSLITTLFVFSILKAEKVSRLQSTHDLIINQSSILFTKQVANIRQSSFLIFQYIKDGHSVQKTFNPEPLLNRVSTLLPNISQVRVLDEDGMELVRVNVRDGIATTVASEELQNKSNRDYYLQARKLAPDSLYLSQIDLNIEQGVVVKPIEPTIRAVYHWQLDKRFYLVINYQLTELYQQLRNLSTDSTFLKVSAGTDYFIIHPDKKKEWASSFEERNATLSNEYPSLADTLNNNVSTRFYYDSELGYVSGLKLSILNEEINDKDSTSGLNDLIFLTITNKDQELILFYNVYVYTLLTLFLSIVVFGLLGYKELSQKRELKRLNQQLDHEHKQLKCALEIEQKLKDELVQAEKMASLGFLVSGVAHELNTPIGAAKMTSSNLKTINQDFGLKIEQGISKSDLLELVEGNVSGNQHIQNCLQKSSDIIKRFKRLAVDRHEEEVQTFDLITIINDVLDSMGPILREAKITTKLHAPKILEMQSYPGALSQTIQNIVKNSMDHAFEGVTFRRIDISANASRDSVQIVFEDNGIGLSQTINDVFEPFATTARHQGNTGLGLHLVHQWVNQLLKGSVSISTRNEGGTSVNIRVARYISDKPDSNEN